MKNVGTGEVKILKIQQATAADSFKLNLIQEPVENSHLKYCLLGRNARRRREAADKY